MNVEHPPGATPLDADTLAGLIPSLETQAELNEFEQENIIAATQWLRRNRSLRKDYPTVSALRRLHREMFNLTWQWAGEFRLIDTNIGVYWPLIPEQLKTLCDDTRYWVEKGTFESWPERGARFHHRLVSIHPFPNGNGRHARLATDILLRQNGQTAFTWGSASLVAVGPARKAYIAALQAADRGDYSPLVEFVAT